jgi:hypothetical protein
LELGSVERRHQNRQLLKLLLLVLLVPQPV